MLTVSVLTNQDRPISTLGLVEPLLKNRRLFREYDINISQIYEKLDEVIETDVLLVDSKYFRTKWATKADQALSEICQLKPRVDKLFFYDSSDSTGTVQAQVIPVVDRYLKAQVLRNRCRYQEKLYGGRVYTDSFFKEGKVEDSQPLYSQGVSLDELSKIRTAWNVGLAGEYGTAENIFRKLRIHKALRLYRPRRNRYCEPGQFRKLDLFLRMSLNQERNTVAYQRKQSVKFLEHLQAPTGPVKKKKYLEEMRESKVVVAPFSWGEMSMRDFECFVSGGVLIKPNMSHVETFPDYYKEGETYIPVDWALSDLHEVVDRVLENYDDYIEIAIEGQKRFKYFAEELPGRVEFVEYASDIFRNVA